MQNKSGESFTQSSTEINEQNPVPFLKQRTEFSSEIQYLQVPKKKSKISRLDLMSQPSSNQNLASQKYYSEINRNMFNLTGSSSPTFFKEGRNRSFCRTP